MSSKMQRFGQLVAARRRALGRSQLAITAAGGPSNTTLTGIENGTLKSISPATLRKLDTSLAWVPGSAQAAWEQGAKPQPLPIPVAVQPDEGRERLATASDVALLSELARRLDRARGQGEDREPAPMTTQVRATHLTEGGTDVKAGSPTRARSRSRRT